MYERAGSDRIGFAEEQLEAAQARLGKARQALADLKASVPASDGAGNSEQSSASVDSELARLEPAVFERDIAQKSYDSARAALENTRVEVLQEKRYIVIISQPSLPTGSIHPRRLWGIVTVFVLSIVLMGVLTMLGAAVREHARF
jgi:capsular polysaccharide transport system permease protein